MDTHNLFLAAFDRIYILNLPERTDRRYEMQEQLKLVGLSFEMPIVQLFAAQRPSEKGEWESLGARGCFMSHLAILRDAEKDKLDSVLILEDDANWSRAFLSDPKQYLETIASRAWDFFDCGGPIKERGMGPPVAVDVHPEVGIVTTHCIGLRADAIGRAAAYLHRIATRKAGDPDGGPMHVDGAYSWFRRENPDISTLSFSPTMAYQRASMSNIGVLSPIERISSLSHALRAYRALKNKLLR